MFHLATPEFEGSFVELHDLVVSRHKQAEKYLRYIKIRAGAFDMCIKRPGKLKVIVISLNRP